MEQKTGFSHDRIDALVASVIGWCEERLQPAPEVPSGDVAFTDEWERKMIARELDWN